MFITAAGRYLLCGDVRNQLVLLSFKLVNFIVDGDLDLSYRLGRHCWYFGKWYFMAST